MIKVVAFGGSWRSMPPCPLAYGPMLEHFPMFSISITDGQARCGVLSTPGGTIDTPALLVYTHRGSPLNLTADLLEKLPDVQGLQLDVLHL